MAARRGRLRLAALDGREAIQGAADAETAIALEMAFAVEDRQAGHFDRQPLVLAVERPVDDDAAPGFARRERRGDLALRIELEFGRDLRPRAVEHGGGLCAQQAGEFFRAEREAVGRIHLPDETEGKAVRARFRGGRVGGGGRRVAAAAIAGVAAAAGFAAAGCWPVAVAASSSVKVIAGAELEQCNGPSCDVALGLAVERRLARELVGAERDQVAAFAEALAVPRASSRSARRRR